MGHYGLGSVGGGSAPDIPPPELDERPNLPFAGGNDAGSPPAADMQLKNDKETIYG